MAHSQTIVVTASSPLASSLQLVLQDLSPTHVVPFEALIAQLEQAPPDLLVVELAAAPEDLSQQLVDVATESASRLAIVSIGEPDISWPNLYPLSASASVAEVARVAAELLRGESPRGEPPPVIASPTKTALPKPSQPPPSVHSLPAPLLASSAPPSSQPSSPRPPRAGTPLAQGPLEEAAAHLELSSDVRELLAEAERKVGVSSRRIGSPAPPPRSNAPSFVPSSEMLAALDTPIDARAASASETAPSDRPASRTPTGGSQRRALASQAPTGPGMSSAPPSSAAAQPSPARRTSAPFPANAHSSGVPTRDFGPGGPARPLTPSSSPPPDAPEAPTTRPPAAGASLGSDVVPAAPPLPRGSWVQRALGAHDADGSSSAAPPSAWDPGTGFDPQAPQPSASEPGTAQPSTAQPQAIRQHGTAQPSTAQHGTAQHGTAQHGTAQPQAIRQHGGATPAESTAPPVEESTSPPAAPSLASDLPPLREGDSVSLIAQAIRRRFSGAIAFETTHGVRRLVMRDGDFVTAASGLKHESLLSYLITRGTLSPELDARLGHKLPTFGRHAGAALIAGGYLAQDQLWPVLRSHAEDIIGRILQQADGVAAFEDSVPERLSAEPAVFGGATGSEVLIELLRRVLSPEQALERLGGLDRELHSGSAHRLLEECALSATEQQALDWILQRPLSEALSRAPSAEFPCVLYGLTQLGVLDSRATAAKPRPPRARKDDPLDQQAIRQMIVNRRALVDDGDYFELLGVPRTATGYDIRRAFLELRRQFEPARVLTPATLDLRDDVELINEILVEAYEILEDAARRDRYRRALESVPNGW